MFQKDQWIVYGSTGVCRVAQIGPLKELSGADPDTLYYTLEPLCGTDIIYVPVDTQAFMRPVITRQQALDLIDRIPTLHEDHYKAGNRRLLTDQYQASLRSHSCEELVELIAFIYHKQQRTLERGRRLSETDQRYRKRAEELLHGEFSIALDIPLEEVQPYIAKRLQKS